jgi:hypothetical protein
MQLDFKALIFAPIEGVGSKGSTRHGFIPHLEFALDF